MVGNIRAQGLYFGTSVSLNGDGTKFISWALVYSTNMVYYFTYSSGAWAFNQYISPPANLPFTGQYMAVALSSDGNTAVLGDQSYNRAYVSTLSGSSFTTAKLLVAKGVVFKMGTSVDVSDNGEVLVVGAPGGNTPVSGAAMVFLRTNGRYSCEALVRDGDLLSGGNLGQGVAVSGNGMSAAAGSPNLNGNAGAVTAWVAAT